MAIYYSIPWDSDMNIGRSYNDFMKMLPTDSDFACFVDADAMFLTSNFGKQLEDIIEKYPECGLFTAKTNRVKHTRQVIGDWNSNDISEHRKTATDMQTQYYDEVEDMTDIMTGMLSGVIILIRKSTWRKIGGFKDGMLGVDNDIHLKAYMNFERVYLMKGVYVYHWYRGGNRNEISHLITKKEKNDILENVKKNKKKIIYSAITGEYEAPIPHRIPKGWEYRLYSNVQGVGTHHVKNLGLSDVKLARRIKIMPWEYFDFDVCVWIDGNTVFDPNAIEELAKNDFVISHHPERDCTYAEAKAILKFDKDKPEIIEPIIKRYKDEGMPENTGMVASHAIVRKNTPENRRFCELWWKEVEQNSHRDQMSFNYVLWKNPINIFYITFKTFFKTVSVHRKLRSRYAFDSRRRM